MKSKQVEKNVLYNARSMFELVSDVEKYPLFVPACKSLKIINKYEKEEITYIDATMRVGYGILNEFFTSHITINKHNFTLAPQILGGGQEKGIRAGTENIL